MLETLNKPSRWVVLGLLGATVVGAPLHVGAQESMLTGLGWHKNSAGTEVDSNSSVQLQGNTSKATVTASGGKVSALANVGMSVDLVGTAQANSIGLAGIQMQSSQVQVLGNKVNGFINALGGAATANVALISSGSGSQPLSSSHVLVQGNRASNVDAFGAKANVLLGTGSFQMPGRATANGVLLDGTQTRQSQFQLTDNEARGITSIGGSALANALTSARSNLNDVRILSSGNRADDVRAGGGSAGVGRGTLAQVNLTGVAAANTVAIASSELKGARFTLAENRASQLTATGGSVLANSISFTDHQLTGGAGYRADLTGNEARNVQAWGGEGSILGGALAQVSMSAAALANAVSVQRGKLEQGPVHSISNNRASDVVATGGGASANSLWLDDATVQGGRVQISGNRAEQVRTAGASGSIGGGLIASVDRNGRALGNSVAVDRQATLDRSNVALLENTSRNVTGSGGFAAANSLTVSEGRVQNSSVTLMGNQADQVQSTGFAAGVGGGVLYSTAQQSAALANTLAVTGSQLDARSVALISNRASQMSARGGILMANSVSLEDGGGSPSQLNASGTITGNTASDMTSAAKSSSVVAGLARSESRARAAANSLVLHDNASMNEASSWLIASNQVQGLHVDGGTALVNALGAYRGARIQNSPVTIVGNTGQDIRASGGSSQVAGVGSKSNGVLAANSLYMDGTTGNSLSNTQVQIAANQARQLNAQGGRINANALAINGQGSIDTSTVSIAGNTASNVRSEGNEGTLAGFAAFGRGVGQANANAVQVLSSMRTASLQLMGNRAGDVSSSNGLAAANSISQGDAGNGNNLHAMIAANSAGQTRADGGNMALSNSVQIEGTLANSSVQLMANQGSAQASGRDAVINSVRAKKSGRISESSATVMANKGSVRDATANSVDMDGTLQAGSITILGNSGSASNGGVINSVVGKGRITGSQVTILGNSGSANDGTANSVKADGSIAGAQITILGNQGNVQGGGTVNSVTGSGSIKGSQITIAANSGRANGGGTVNSVKNSGSIAGAQITVAGNQGTATGGGTVNSVDNRGQLTGMVTIAGNTGSATGGGTVNSLVNQGIMTGAVIIAGNRGRTAVGGVSNSVINQGVITGAVAIVGNSTMAAAGITSGSVRNIGGAIVGAAGVVGNTAFAANPGYTYATPSVGVVNNSVTVVPAFNIISN